MIEELFRERFGAWPDVVASAPGRVNLIGEHTDYNEGFVFPMAIDRRTRVAAGRRADGRVVALADTFREEREIVLASLTPPPRARRWADYVAGVAWALGRVSGLEGSGESGGAAPIQVPGANILISGNVPVGAGLSSSAALELAVARTLCAMADVEWEPVAMANVSKRAENEFVGVSCGIMDQMAASASRRDHAFVLDCRTLDRSYAAMPSDIVIVVMDTGVRRSLSASEYNARRADCEEAARIIRALDSNVRTLRDVSPALLDRASPGLSAIVAQRARHVVEENIRPAALSRALQSRDFGTAGGLMNDSHASLRDLYEVSSTHLDIICEVARSHPACYGARMTGAGFGGCAIALVRADAADDFIRWSLPRYEGRTYKRSLMFVAAADDGARLERLRQ